MACLAVAAACQDEGQHPERSEFSTEVRQREALPFLLPFFDNPDRVMPATKHPKEWFGQRNGHNR